MGGKSLAGTELTSEAKKRFQILLPDLFATSLPTNPVPMLWMPSARLSL